MNPETWPETVERGKVDAPALAEYERALLREHPQALAEVEDATRNFRDLAHRTEQAAGGRALTARVAAETEARLGRRSALVRSVIPFFVFLLALVGMVLGFARRLFDYEDGLPIVTTLLAVSAVLSVVLLIAWLPVRTVIVPTNKFPFFGAVCAVVAAVAASAEWPSVYAPGFEAAPFLTVLSVSAVAVVAVAVLNPLSILRQRRIVRRELGTAQDAFQSYTAAILTAHRETADRIASAVRDVPDPIALQQRRNAGLDKVIARGLIPFELGNRFKSVPLGQAGTEVVVLDLFGAEDGFRRAAQRHAGAPTTRPQRRT